VFTGTPRSCLIFVRVYAWLLEGGKLQLMVPPGNSWTPRDHRLSIKDPPGCIFPPRLSADIPPRDSSRLVPFFISGRPMRSRFFPSSLNFFIRPVPCSLMALPHQEESPYLPSFLYWVGHSQSDSSIALRFCVFAVYVSTVSGDFSSPFLPRAPPTQRRRRFSIGD